MQEVASFKALGRCFTSPLFGSRASRQTCQCYTTRQTSSIPKRTLWQWGTTQGGENPWRALLKTSVIELPKEPQVVPGFSNVPITAITTGYDHAALIVDGDLYTFGTNSSGQLGRTIQGEMSGEPGRVSFPEETPSSAQICAVACGGSHTAAITNDGGLYTWGDSGGMLAGVGALGLSLRGSVATPTRVTTLQDVGEQAEQVACGSRHTIVLSKSGRLFSAGKGEMGRLGLGSNQDKRDFHEIEFFYTLPFPVSFKKVVCGASHSVALLESGDVYVWGRNDAGQLGLDDSMGDMFSHEAFPRELVAQDLATENVVDVNCAESATVVLTKKGNVFFFGARLWLTPIKVGMPPDVAQELKEDPIKRVVAGGRDYHFVYALTESGRVLSWGNRKSGCLGRPCEDKHSGHPAFLDQNLFQGHKVIDIACGRSHVLALTEES